MALAMRQPSDGEERVIRLRVTGAFPHIKRMIQRNQLQVQLLWLLCREVLKKITFPTKRGGKPSGADHHSMCRTACLRHNGTWNNTSLVALPVKERRLFRCKLYGLPTMAVYLPGKATTIMTSMPY